MALRTFLKRALGHIQSRLDFENWSDHPQFATKIGLGRVALVTLCLGVIGTLHLVSALFILFSLWNRRSSDENEECFKLYWSTERCILFLQWCTYMIAVCVFHLLEFFVTAIWNPTMVDADSFLVNHSLSYTAAFLTSLTEFWLRFLFFPSSLAIFKSLPWIGLIIAIASQVIRSLAMATAGESFNHVIQTQKKENHVLVTDGIYRLFRHPSYVGFFYWSISVQMVLGNAIHTVLFAFTSWNFFHRRIPYEEESLCQLFPNEYPSYVAGTWMGIPFIKSTVVPAPTVEPTMVVPTSTEPQQSKKKD
ncbi:hypothetical protein ACA910_004132 [Epithemia clementina (nom. ined.)]